MGLLEVEEVSNSTAIHRVFKQSFRTNDKYQSHRLQSHISNHQPPHQPSSTLHHTTPQVPTTNHITTKMSAYFLHQPSRASLKLHPSVQSNESTPRASTSTQRSYDSMKSPILSEKPACAISSSEKKTSTPKKILQTIKQGWKEHHESVQASYDAYYGQGASTGRILGNAYQKKD